MPIDKQKNRIELLRKDEERHPTGETCCINRSFTAREREIYFNTVEKARVQKCRSQKMSIAHKSRDIVGRNLEEKTVVDR